MNLEILECKYPASLRKFSLIGKFHKSRSDPLGKCDGNLKAVMAGPDGFYRQLCYPFHRRTKGHRICGGIESIQTSQI